MTDATVVIDSHTAVAYVDGVPVPVVIGGAEGPAGPQGPTGATGTAGNTILSGSGAPSAATGVNGDFYIKTAAPMSIYGPKTAGAWGAATSLIGPQGTTGPRGYSVLNGTTNPTAGVGVDGDFYINTTTTTIFGPKAAGAWPSGVSLIGPQGPQGIQGPAGPPGEGGVDDAAFGAGWDGATVNAPSKNAVYDEMIKKAALAGGNTFTGSQNFSNTVNFTGGTPSIQTGIFELRALNSSGNSTFFIKDEAGLNQGVLFWNRASDEILLRRYAADGASVEGQLAISSLGGGTVTSTGNLASHAKDSASNAGLYLRDENAVSQAILYWDRASDTVVLRRYGADGTSLEGALYITATTTELRSGATVSRLTLSATDLTFTGATIWVATDKLLIQHNGTNGYLRTQSGPLMLGSGGSTNFTIDPTPTTIRLAINSAGDVVVTSNLTVADEAYSALWNGSLAVPTKNAVYDKIQTLAPLAPRVQTAGSNSVTPTFADDYVIRTGATGAIVLNNPTGTAEEGHGTVIRLKDNGTARAISYGTQYRAVGVTLPTTTVVNKLTILGMIYDALDTKWNVVSVAQEA